MEHFSLEKWLQDKSRKVVTRDGRSVRIVCTDSPILHHPIVGFVECDLFTWTDDGKVIYGDKCENKNDLFFAEDKEELTEFEKAIYIDICTIVTACNGNVYGDKELKPIVKGIAKELLDLARKELEKEIGDKCWEAYLKGEEETLKDLPKWKKITKSEQNYLAYGYLSHDGYYLSIQELKDKLPKEE